MTKENLKTEYCNEYGYEVFNKYNNSNYTKFLEDKIIAFEKQLSIHGVVKSLKDKEVPTFEEWKKANYIHYDKGLFTRKAEGLSDLDQLIKKYDKEILNL